MATLVTVAAFLGWTLLITISIPLIVGKLPQDD